MKSQPSILLTALILVLTLYSCNRETSEKKQKSLMICTEMPLKPDTTDHGITAGILSSKKWEWNKGAEREIRVCFLDGGDILIQKVMDKAKLWEPIAKVKFREVDFVDNPDVKISFLGEGSWSKIGTDAKGEDISMNLGWLTTDSPDQEYSRVVLHEFGHVLGLVHEHSLVSGNPIEWDRKKVKAYYMNRYPFWNEQQIEDNIYHRYASESLNGGQYDPQSIMIYGVPGELLKSKKEIKWNNKISVNDKKTVFDAYW